MKNLTWGQFEDHFGHAYSDFFEKINKHYPGLSTSKKRN